MAENRFKLTSPFKPTGDQPKAIEALVKGFSSQKKHQTLLGVTGSGKTFTVANTIQHLQQPTLIIAHNKTLAAQLYQEFRDFFPNNAVSYFVSYYDYYQPEAYIPTTDTYIEKEATINDEIDKLRLATTTNLLTRSDVIVVASVSCIYNLGSPVEYGRYQLQLVAGELIARETLLLKLTDLQYDRSDSELRRGNFRIRGDVIQVWPAYEDKALRIEMLESKITAITWIDPISGSAVVPPKSEITNDELTPRKRFIIYPAKHYVINPKTQQDAIKEIQADLAQRISFLESKNKVVEAYRLQQKVNYDLEMMQEFGFVGGIENYSRYFDGREPGDPPFTLLDYFHENARLFGDGKFLTVIDESHITIPQVRGMHNGDRARKETLIEYGFRLPSAIDNRPLRYEEFATRTPQTLYVSATPSEFEVNLSQGQVVEQLIRPTGLTDPEIELRPVEGQIEDLIVEIIHRKQKGQRTLVTTLTKKMAEALTAYLNDEAKVRKLVTSSRSKNALINQSDQSETVINANQQLDVSQMEIGPIAPQFQTRAEIFTPSLKASDLPKVAYLHSDIETLERSDILDDLRRGVYDVVVGINLLREGLDLPEVTLVAILDADKEGFLRSDTSLIQTMGRAARHQDGRVILYADKLTGSMKRAITETDRRRSIQVAYNQKHQINPETISKPIRERMIEKVEDTDAYIQKKVTPGKQAQSQPQQGGLVIDLNKAQKINLEDINPEELTPYEKTDLAKKLKRKMNQAANALDYELAAILRDLIKDLEKD